MINNVNRKFIDSKKVAKYFDFFREVCPYDNNGTYACDTYYGIISVSAIQSYRMKTSYDEKHHILNMYIYVIDLSGDDYVENYIFYSYFNINDKSNCCIEKENLSALNSLDVFINGYNLKK